MVTTAAHVYNSANMTVVATLTNDDRTWRTIQHTVAKETMKSPIPNNHIAVIKGHQSAKAYAAPWAGSMAEKLALNHCSWFGACSRKRAPTATSGRLMAVINNGALI